MGKYGDVVDDRVLTALSRAAAEGLVCPGNDALAGLSGVIGSATASGSVKRLERAGRIIVERGNNSRVVTIVATGKKTAGTISAPHWRARAAGAVVADEVKAEADRASRRREAAKRSSVAARMKGDDPEILPPALYREPCVRCGVRGDIGCRRQGPA